MSVASVDVERFANNIARMIENGGKALAAYMKPREEGKIKAGPSDEIVDMVKTLGQVMEYWLSDPQRAVELQTRIGKAYLELVSEAMKRLSGETYEPIVKADADLVLVWGEGASFASLPRGAKVILLGSYLAPENGHADAFIPVSIQTERAGHYTNFEGTVSEFRACFGKKPGASRTCFATRSIASIRRT